MDIVNVFSSRVPAKLFVGLCKVAINSIVPGSDPFISIYIVVLFFIVVMVVERMEGEFFLGL